MVFRIHIYLNRRLFANFIVKYPSFTIVQYRLSQLALIVHNLLSYTLGSLKRMFIRFGRYHLELTKLAFRGFKHLAKSKLAYLSKATLASRDADGTNSCQYTVSSNLIYLHEVHVDRRKYRSASILRQRYNILSVH